MKRLSSSDSLGALMSICPTTEEHSAGNNHMYGRSTLDGLDEEDSGGQMEKKRRLSVDQVKALEKNFEVDNKLEPERKVKLARELGLQPRQVAVWFQNRRARWKTKQLERDYGLLKANYDSLNHNYDTLHHHNDSLLKEIKELKAKLNGEKNQGNPVKKEQVMACENKDNMYEQVLVTNKSLAAIDSIGQCDNTTTDTNLGASVVTTFFQDGSSDSDSSAILNEDNNNNNNNNSPNSSTGVFGHPSSSSDCFRFSSASDSKTILGDAQKAYQPQFVKIEEHDFFSGDESCNFFSDDQAPSLQWYCHDQWN